MSRRSDTGTELKGPPLHFFGLSAVPLYYFDTSDGETFVADEEGVELAGIHSASYAATQALGEMAKDALPGATLRELLLTFGLIKPFYSE